MRAYRLQVGELQVISDGPQRVENPISPRVRVAVRQRLVGFGSLIVMFYMRFARYRVRDQQPFHLVDHGICRRRLTKDGHERFCRFAPGVQRFSVGR